MLIDYITSASADIYADRQMRLIIENGQHETVGMVDLINFDPRHLRAEIGIVIKDEVRGKGYAQEAIRQLLVYSKEILHLHQLYAIVSTKNEKAVKMLHSVGFEGSKMLKEWLFEGDFYVDAYLFQCFLYAHCSCLIKTRSFLHYPPAWCSLLPNEMAFYRCLLTSCTYQWIQPFL